MSWEAYCHLLQLKENNNDSRGLLLSSTIEAKQRVGRLVVIFSNWSETTKDDNESKSWLVIVFSTWGKKPKDDNKLFSSSLSSTTEERNAKNDNEPRGSLSIFATKAKQPRTMMNQDFGLLSSSTPKEKN